MLAKKKKLYTATGILFGIAILLFLFGLNEDWVSNYYSNGLYPIIAAILRSISGIFPFAIGDFLYLLLILFALWQLFLPVKKLHRKVFSKEYLGIGIVKLSATVLALYITFKLLWGLNYSRPSIARQLHISDQKYNAKELVELGKFFIDRVNTLRSKTSKAYPDFEQLRIQAVRSYQDLAVKNPFFRYSNASAKPVSSHWLISKIGIEGYYNPLSGEANVNTGLVPWVLPFVICHEISHQLGVAREDEANLVAYLTAIHSHDVRFQYSANYNMLRYILFEVRFKSPEDYIAMRDRLTPAVLADLKAENEFWRKYNGHMSSYMGAAFDKFLKLNNQKKGIKSYQDIVVWLWNYHRKEILKGTGNSAQAQ